ncbi:VWA domain-containing protein [Pseudalkalibacillus hwajinpoensis]|uniref:VWA domain-containing protein n=1 Tax=Guptibacillus hwajinpoensis TaxID=208199 RepID=UPI00325BE7E4
MIREVRTHFRKVLSVKPRLTTVLFDDQYYLLWNSIDANDAVLTDQHYYVRGTTALLDAVGKTIVTVGKRLSETEEPDKPEKVIVVITTDGMENSSYEITYEKVKELIQHQQEQYSWEFIFMGANIDAAEEGRSIGIKGEHASQFKNQKMGLRRCLIR